MRADFSIRLFHQAPIVGILRGLAADKIRPVVAAAGEGGLTNLEITMNTAGAAAQIRAARQVGGKDMNIGAGTVTTLALLDAALKSGASFIVTPIVVPHVIQRCVVLGVPVFPGALTPTEIAQAWDMGATMVKIFPADAFGPQYLRSLKGPLPQVRLMPTGGVDRKTLAAYAQAGADAYGIGTPLFRPERMAANDWPWLRKECAAFVSTLNAVKK
jgi:2-dehydro-3-deoxyphosphogluconate aldolase/(4S)-4-hydroxy-2-oxoglutarate aldolase